MASSSIVDRSRSRRGVLMAVAAAVLLVASCASRSEPRAEPPATTPDAGTRRCG